MTLKFENAYVKDTDVVVGAKEAEGPLKNYFKKSYNNPYAGAKTWEQAESKMALETMVNLLERNNVDLIVGGDLLNQITATSFAVSKFKIPFLGIYNACATSTEGIILAASYVDNKLANDVLVNVSSHNNAAEKQFRYPVEYGGPKPLTTTFTVTGSAGMVVSNTKTKIKIESATIGEIVDYDIKSAYEMGAVMAPACADTLNRHLKDLNRKADYYDLILSGDLGEVGKKILKELVQKDYKINLKNYNDAGTMIFNTKKQSVYSGGSGPACLPLVAYTYILEEMKKGNLKRVLLIATGALLSSTTVNQHLSIPGIAHAVSLEVI